MNLYSKNRVRNIRILGRVIVLGVAIPLLWFDLFLLNSLARPLGAFGIAVIAILSNVLVDNIAGRKSLPSSPET